MEHDTEPITQCVQHGKKWPLPLHDINDVMHSQNIKLKHHMKMFTKLNIYVVNPSMTMS
jgi:hypothetical protein